MSSISSWGVDSSVISRVTFRVQRVFKALDDGKRRKWVIVVRLQDLPTTFPLDANARIPNVLRNRKACSAMRSTLLTRPELFQVFNSGVVCTADRLEVRQNGNETEVTIAFDPNGGQGIVNGGHSYATAIEVAHGVTSYADGNDLPIVLAEDVRYGRAELRGLVENAQLLAEQISKAKELAGIQLEIVAPVPDADLLAQIAEARNLSQSVEATAFANLAGKFDRMKEVLAEAFGPRFVERIVWKTNQEVPEDSRGIPVKLVVYVLALMNFRTYEPGRRIANEVYSRKGLVTRDFVEAENGAKGFLERLTEVLPALIDLYDHIYFSISQSDPDYPWATGKIGEDARRRGGLTPFFAIPCDSRVNDAFVWPIFSAFRQLFQQDKDSGAIRCLTDPIPFFDHLARELIQKTKEFHKDQAHGLVQQVGKDKEIWMRLEGIVDKELDLQRRLGRLGVPFPAVPRDVRRNQAGDISDSNFEAEESTRSKPAGFRFSGEFVPTSTWKDVYTRLAALLARKHTDFDVRAQELRGTSRPYFSRFPNGMHAPHSVPGTKLFMETCFSADAICKRAYSLLDHFGYSSDMLEIEMGEGRR